MRYHVLVHSGLYLGVQHMPASAAAVLVKKLIKDGWLRHAPGHYKRAAGHINQNIRFFKH